MDPNSVLEQLRNRMRNLRKHMDDGADEDVLDEATSDALDSWEALNGWLASGGFQPDWTKEEDV